MRERWLYLLPVLLLAMTPGPGQCFPRPNRADRIASGEGELLSLFQSGDRTVPVTVGQHAGRRKKPQTRDQLLTTVTDELIDEDTLDLKEELEFIKRKLLSELGLKRIPDPNKRNVSEAEMQKMMDLYRRSVKVETQEEEEDSSTSGGNSQSSWDSPSATEGVHRIYTYKDTAADITDNLDRTTDNCDQWLFFQVADTSREPRIRSLRSAKLHLRNPCHCGGYQQSETSTDQARVAIYQMTEQWEGQPDASSSSSRGGGGRILVEERLLRAQNRQKDTWAVFDISKPAAVWLEKESLNHGLLVKCYGIRNAHRHSRSGFNVGVGQSRENETAILDLTVRERHVAPAAVTSRIKRSRKVKEDRKSKPVDGKTRLGRRLGTRQVRNNRRARMECTTTNNSTQCCRYSLRVSFADIGYDWIVSPKHFEANFCRGHCNARSKNYASTHAMIQSFLNHKQTKSNEGVHVPRPCCTPSKMNSLKILHQNEENKIVMTVLQNMIVENCACS